MSVIYLDMKFYFIIKSLFAIRFFKILAPHQHRAMATLVLVVQSDIILASFSIDILNVIYRSHTLILLVCLLQIYVHSSSYTSLITGNALKNNNDGNFLQKSSTMKTKIAAIFYVNATLVCKMQFHWSSRMEWPGINQSVMIFLPPCALVYDVMPFCVDDNLVHR